MVYFKKITSNLQRYICVIAVVTLAFPMVAKAETIDYGSLESLFGESVTTSATGQPQRASEVPVTMEIITADDIRRSGAVDIPDVLRHVPGISVWRFSRDTAEVSVRGYNQPYSPRLLVLVNGRQVYADEFGYTAWGTIPVALEEIRQIEVVKGPNTALFGFNALAGVVNIITYNPMYDDISSVGVLGGTDQYYGGHAIHTVKPSDKIAVRVSAGGMRVNERENSFPIFSDPQQGRLNLDSVVQLTDKSQFRFEASRALNNRNESTNTFLSQHSRYTHNSLKGTYSAETGMGLFSATLYHNAFNKQLTSNPGIVDNAVTVAQVENVFRVGTDHRFRVQAEFRDNSVESDVYWGPDAKLGFNTYAASGMWNWNIRNNLQWTNATRVEHLRLDREGPPLNFPGSPFPTNDFFDKSMTEYSYNSGLVWQATEKDTLRFMTGRGIQPPTLVDFGLALDIGNLAPGLFFTGNPDTEATSLTNYEIGYDRDIDLIDGHAFANVFYQKTRKIKYTGDRIVGAALLADNIGNSDSIGFEIGADGRFDEKWRWGLNYMYQDVDDDLRPGQGTDYNGELWTPKHTINANIGYSDGPWEVDAFAQYVSEYAMNEAVAFSTANTAVGNTLSVSARVGYEFGDGTVLSFSGQELNHASTRQTSLSEIERRVFLGLTKKF